MAFSKANLYPADLQKTSATMKTFANPARLQILFYLHVHGRCRVQEIAEHHPVSLETISGHLAILREDHLVSCAERFPYTFYQLDQDNLPKAIALIREFLDKLDPGKATED
jgi:DNA-binding transcriptional ArsR family regulator